MRGHVDVEAGVVNTSPNPKLNQTKRGLEGPGPNTATNIA